MCGIFGWIPSDGRRLAPVRPVAEGLLRALRHRGPDDAGYVVFPDDPKLTPRTEKQEQPESCRLLLGQTRLAIIDLSTAGHQPMFSPDKRFALIYNGEVYNYRELRAELEDLGLSFRTATDTEVVLLALVAWGEKALSRFTGMFALALYDARERALFLARDFFGIKPLYYYAGSGTFCFASELPALLRFPGTPRLVDAQAAYQFLCHRQYDCGPRTFVKEVRQVPAGHFLRLDLEELGRPLQPHCYWKPDISGRLSLGFAEAADRLRELFLKSVKLHLRSDVPLGVALSGGIDSSALTFAVRHLEPGLPLHTFSFIAKGSPVSEERWAALAAERAGALRHTVEVEPPELVRDLDSMLRALGEPFGSTSIYAQYRVFKLARDCGLKVTLDGQGADELLAGYHGYPGQRVSTLLRSRQPLRALRFLCAAHNWPGRSWACLMLQTAREFAPEWLAPLALRCLGHSNAPPWLDIESLRDLGLRLRREDRRDELFPCPDKVRQILAYQLVWNGLPQLLRHGDRNSMAFSIESRVPFLTREMAEFCLSLPEEYLIDMNGRTKSVFREAMRGLVPDALLERRDKIGFATPEQDWLNALAPWVEETLSEARHIPYLNMPEVRKEWLSMHEGRQRFDWRLWRWLNYVRWVRLFGLEA